MAAVLSGNRNFEGRVNPHVKANYLACRRWSSRTRSPARRHRPRDRAARHRQGRASRCSSTTSGRRRRRSRTRSQSCVTPRCSSSQYATSSTGRRSGARSRAEAASCSRGTRTAPTSRSRRSSSTCQPAAAPIQPIRGARCLVTLGDSVTTDHISPAGSIKKDSPAGAATCRSTACAADFNSYGSRRGNDRVMTRGTFANIRLRNLLAPGTEGGVTTDFTVHGATREARGGVVHLRRRDRSTRRPASPLVVLAGKDYGMGSVARLGGEGHVPARRARSDRRELRAHPPQQPGRHGRAAAASSRARAARRSASTARRRSTSPLDDDAQAAPGR